jgi:signal transduction histidine kinase
VAWPWRSATFFVLLMGLIFLSVTGGFALSLATQNQGVADLLISVLVFASALAAGAFFPYPETSRIWSAAPYNPFTHVMVRFLSLVRGESSAPGTLEAVVWLAALGFAAVVLWQLRHDTLGHTISIDAPDAVLRRDRPRFAWLARRRTIVACGLGVVALPVAIWLAGPAGFVPAGGGPAGVVSAGARGTAGLMYPYAGLTTVLLLVLNMLFAAPVVDGSVGIVNTRSYRTWFLLKHGGAGVALILMSAACAMVLWQPPFLTLAHTVLALGLFHLWSLLFMYLLATLSRDRSVYWVFGVSATLLVSFLGGSLFRPALLGPLGRVVSPVLPNGLLLYHAAIPGLALVSVQCALLVLAADPVLQRKLRRGRAPKRAQSPTTAPVTRTPGPERVRGGMVESLVLRERRRILDEVHDTLGHGITGALWQIRSARGMTDDPSLRETLDRAAEGLEYGLSRIRSYLRDSAPRRSGDWSELYATIERFTHCPVDLSLGGDSGSFQPVAVQRFTQTVQELLTNALRYGDPTSIRIELTRTARFHRLEYREHGRGWGDTGPRMGYGLSTIQALFTEHGGSFHLGHLPDRNGIEVIAITPIQEAHTDA